MFENEIEAAIEAMGLSDEEFGLDESEKKLIVGDFLTALLANLEEHFVVEKAFLQKLLDNFEDEE